MVQQEIRSRQIPNLLERGDMLEILLREEYGYIPSKPDAITFEEAVMNSNFCAGKARLLKITATCNIGEKQFSFPFYASIPMKEKKYPFFVHINFRDNIPDLYMPTEEIIDNGFAVLSFCYKDVTSDDGDFTNGFAGVLYPDRKRTTTDAGKLAMWAWAAHRVMDYAETHTDIFDISRSIVCGHSRLGKTALLAAATDERFAFAYSNDSGCSGAAITRNKQGERVEDICRVFPYWFCENYKKYVGNENSMPFDQHYLIASIAPRKVCVGSAVEDIWADPRSEFLSCVAASPVYEKQGMSGFMHRNEFPKAEECFFEGNIGYHLRSGTHYFSREDWHRIMSFVNSH